MALVGKRGRDSMKDLLSIVTAPEMTCDEKEAQDLEDLRKVPLQQEETLIWAIQPGS